MLTSLIEGQAFYLKPVELGDADFIISLRNNDHVRYLHRIENSIEKQKEWLKSFFKSSDFYWIVINKYTDEREGAISLYNIEGSTAEWGRWVIQKNSLAAVESAYLLYQFAFERLHLESVYCRTIQDNKKVISFHDHFGCKKRAHLIDHFEIEEKKYSAIEHIMNAESWDQQKMRLEVLCKKTSELIRKI